MKDLPSVSIESSIASLWPDTALGCLFYTAVVSAGETSLWDYLEQSLLPPLEQKLKDAPLTDMPNIAQSRAAYKAFGKDPGRWRISSEALYRRVRQGKPLYRINSLVDANNLISLETGFSLGSYDLAGINGDLLFRLGRAGESYQGIGKDEVNLENMPLLADAAGPLGSPTSDSTRAMITPATGAALSVIFSFSGSAGLEAALELAALRFSAFAGACEIKRFIVTP